MNELYETGWMHNRTRMITASFLTKNLLIPWQEGEKWFRIPYLMQIFQIILWGGSGGGPRRARGRSGGGARHFTTTAACALTAHIQLYRWSAITVS